MGGGGRGLLVTGLLEGLLSGSSSALGATDTEWETYTVEVPPPAPPCVAGQDHDWHSPPPEVKSHGGGGYVDVCSRCGMYRNTNTCPLGEVVRKEFWYEPADERSLRWVESFSESEAASLPPKMGRGKEEV